MLVGEGPGEQEDLTGKPFVGRAGQLQQVSAVTAYHGVGAAAWRGLFDRNDVDPAAVDDALRRPDGARQAFTPMLAILCAQHETQYSRLFRS